MGKRSGLIAGNWKMNGRKASLEQLDLLAQRIGREPGVEIVICPPLTLIAAAAERVRAAPITIGAQDCRPESDGAFTGDVNAEMLADLGARYVIVGHSERRQGRGESDGLVRAKAEAVQKAGLTPIVCVGETLEERRAGRAIAAVHGQVAGSIPPAGATVVAYEPVWAIGSGLTPTAGDIELMHAGIRQALGDIAGAAAEAARVLYGGSVKPGNAYELLAIPGVDGALVGGASLLASDFAAVIAAHPDARLP